MDAPDFDFRCPRCEERIEETQGPFDPESIECPHCSETFTMEEAQAATVNRISDAVHKPLVG